ncbi:BfmA/BtgA family mobilization protein [Gillisia sp. Hel_I_29]|uniref:BfmA/BtgA family mobilization protein n=1 Tax=Gillisia sp. Hel_I_29 TaxID=1249975 RepID=UPI00055251FC|nr:BfmA/BtgA family mobilization protein [Gillisia sp. Hel_I_29]
MSKNFSRINFHSETVERFKKYAIENDVNYTESMEAMLDFFEKNYISPFKPFPLTNNRLLHIFNKRMDALEVLLRKMEKDSLEPTLKILLNLIKIADPINKNVYREKRAYAEDDTHPDFYK